MCLYGIERNKSPMATLEKLSIRGVRSFGTDAEDEQVSRRKFCIEILQIFGSMFFFAIRKLRFPHQ